MDLNISVENLEIETERLILRAIRKDDLDDLNAFASVEGVGEAAGWPHHKSKDETLGILKIFLAEKNVLALVFKENGKVIGTLGFHKSWANEDEELKNLNTREIGFVLAKDYWGQGIMTEAVNAIINYCFIFTELDAITVAHFLGNDRSKRVIEKCGFSFYKEGTYYAAQLDAYFKDKRYILYRRNI